MKKKVNRFIFSGVVMMNPEDNSLVINFAPAPEQTETDKPCRFVRLEQARLPDAAANLSDVNAMMLMAASGLSATAYHRDDCPLRVIDDSTIEFDLGFFVFPAPIDLPYTLSASIGAIDGGKRIEQKRSLEAVAEMSRTVDLDGIYTGNLQARTPAINSAGEIIADSCRLDGCRIVQDKEAFRVFWLAGKRHGFEHKLTIRIEDVDKNRVSTLKPKIICRWLDDVGKLQAESIDMDVPQCILDAINDCPNQGGGSSVVLDTSTKVWYSTCDGSPLRVKHYDHK